MSYGKDVFNLYVSGRTDVCQYTFKISARDHASDHLYLKTRCLQEQTLWNVIFRFFI
jgi:hypothetical protein